MLPWPDMFRAALSAGIAPDAFWRLSLKEWRWLSTARGSPMSRAQFDALRLREPTPATKEETGNG